MRFSKTIFCEDVKIEITDDTCVMFDKEDAHNLDEFLEIYGNIPSVEKMARMINATTTEIPFQVDFWRKFCSVLVKSASAGSKCLLKICKGVVSDCISEEESSYIEPDPDTLDGGGWHTTMVERKYKRCTDIKLKDNNYVVVKVQYGVSYGEYYKDVFRKYSLNYPLDYLGLLENMESYIAKKTAPRKGLLQRLLKKKSKAPALSKGDQIIVDFWKANRKEIVQFKVYGQHVKSVEPWKEQANEMYQNFCREGALIIDNRGFPQEHCGFDIFKKKEEVDAIVKKLQNSIDAGEEEVEYAIKWLCAEQAFHFKAIKKNCETKYRYGCILLKNQSFIDEQQEYDHILVSDRGIILIETKNWKGRVEIRSDGKWVRDSENNGCLVGVESPLYQIQRHEALIKSILPNEPIHSLLVFSNPSLILEGRENCNMCSVIYVDQLKETIMNILSSSERTGRTIDYCVNEIEKYKVNIMGDDIRELE